MRGSFSTLRVDPDCSASIEPFWQRIAETIAWCMPRVQASPRDCLRTPSIRGRSLERSYHDGVSRVAIARQGQLLPLQPVPTRDLARGRLMVYFPNADLCDGAAEAVSDGYFDVYNTPPWDTWVAFVCDAAETDVSYSEYLIAWVPPAFLALANDGIMVNPEECIRWLDECEVAFAS